MRRLLGCATALLALSSASSAQLIVAHDDTSGGTNAWLVDVCTGTSEVLWDNTEAWGVAADDANGKVYVADGSTFAVWDYSQQFHHPAIFFVSMRPPELARSGWIMSTAPMSMSLAKSSLR